MAVLAVAVLTAAMSSGRGRGGRGALRKRARTDGAYGGYVACTSWLESAFPGKLWLCSKWEQVKMLCGDCPVPSGLSSVSYGIPEYSADAAVALAIEKLWDTAHYCKKLTTDDLHSSFARTIGSKGLNGTMRLPVC